MANLADIVDAVNRLAEKLSVAPSPSGPDVTVSQPSGTAAGKASTGSVQWEVKVIPYLSAMTKHLSGIHALMQRQSTQAASRAVLPVAQPLMPSPVQRTMHRIQAASIRGSGGSINWLQILSSGLGNTPVVGTALHQANLTKMLLSNLPAAQQAASTGNAAFGGNFAGNVMAGRATASHTANAGGAVGGMALRAGIVAGGLAVVSAALVKFAISISNANRALSVFEPGMAMSFAMSDVTDLFRDMASAQARSLAQMKFNNAYSNFKNAARPVTDMLFNAIEYLATGILEVATPLIKGLGEFLKGIIDLNEYLQKKIDDALGIGKIVTEGGERGLAMSQAQQALQDAIKALRDNTDALNKSGGGGNGMVTAADFMRGVWWTNASQRMFGGAQAGHAPMRLKNRRAPVAAPAVNTGNGASDQDKANMAKANSMEIPDDA